MELYKKYRPSKLGDLVGNHATINAINEKLKKGTLPHFILLSGPSGCGKTTIARIIKEKLNCGNTDFYEINCANRNGVELAREIEQKFRMKSINGGPRIWLLDEVHKMTTACAESLLKPLEDTPEHVYFIFATTEPEKILKTIKTRACHFTVDGLDEEQIEELVKGVCKKEKIKLPEEVLDAICENSMGSARMALVLLDKIKDLSKKEMKGAVQQQVEVEQKAFAILKPVMGWGGGWTACAKALKENKEDPEGVRRYIMASLQNILLNPAKAKQHAQAWASLGCFLEPFYDSGKAGLVSACYDAINGE